MFPAFFMSHVALNIPLYFQGLSLTVGGSMQHGRDMEPDSHETIAITVTGSWRCRTGRGRSPSVAGPRLFLDCRTLQRADPQRKLESIVAEFRSVSRATVFNALRKYKWIDDLDRLANFLDSDFPDTE